MSRSARVHRLWFRSRIAAGAAFLAVSACVAVALPTAAAPAAGAAAGPTVLYVVVFQDGVDARDKASKAGIKPAFVYDKALSGFAANLTPAMRDRFAADPQALMVVPADHSQLPAVKPGTTPIEQFPQVVARGIRRIGTLASPTAHIDGVDERVNADVAVLDGGVDSTQPDLNVKNGTNCAAGDWRKDDSGHGTMVAGVIGALDNSFGVVGVAPGARIWSVRVFDPGADENTDANLLCGLDWVMSHSNTIEIANLSLGGPGADDGNCGLTNHDPVHWATCHVVNRGGVTVVVSAGNESADAAHTVPAAYPEVITVSSLADSDGQPGGLGGPTCEGDPDDTLSFFSNFGAVVDLAAPGDCVGSTYPGGELAIGSGTSFSAPHVAGATALYLATHPKSTPAQVRAALIAHREQTALAGDPDGINEGIVNVGGW